MTRKAKKPPQRRSVRLGVVWVEVKTGWGNAALVLDDKRADRDLRCTIEIGGPNDVAYLRERLDVIEKYWRDQLEGLRR